MNAIEQQICDAIEVIVQQAISQADFDKTIQATVLSCEDETIGKYKVRYQDSTFYAYANNSEVTYTDGSVVYVLIPGNDTSKDKTILGTKEKLGINYVSTIEGEEAFQIIGTNCIQSSSTFALQSYKGGKQVKILYSKNQSSSLNLIKFNEIDINEYIKGQKYIICGGTIKTNLSTEQQFRGNYGIVFALNFNDNTENKIVTRYYTIDVDKMRGNPYKILYDTRQYGIFEIDGDNFIDIDSISLFCYNFPNTKIDAECIDDIFIKNIELCGAEQLNVEDLDNYSLTFYTPQGIYFDVTSASSDTRILQAQVRVKGKVIDNNSQTLPFYWFIEHAGVTSDSKYYNKYGGQGWKCLNQFTTIQSATADIKEVVEWIPHNNIFQIAKKDVVAAQAKIKCVVVYDGTIITKTIVIKNLASGYNITINSDLGTRFYFDNGHPTLTCLVNGEEQTDLSYSWAVEDNTGSFETIVSTPLDNQNYWTAYTNYYNLLYRIQTEAVPYAPNRLTLQHYKEELDRYEILTRVDGNKIYHLDVSDITDFSTYKCTVYQGELYLGTASITLTNGLEAEGTYTLIINNSSYVYKYDEDGVSPASSAVTIPLELQALTFTLYDNLGNEIEESIVQHSDIQWLVPKNNTLIKIPSSIPIIEENDDYYIFNNMTSLVYEIADRYDISKTNNDIILLVNYKGMNLSAKTNLVFTKDGEEGTNGTEFFCRLVPNVFSGREMPMYPIITESANGTWSINYATQMSKRFFRVQLWHNENKILDSVTSTNTTEGQLATIRWKILKNKYSYNIEDESSLTVTEGSGVFDYKGFDYDSPANIVRAEVDYNGVTYYATIPVLTVKLKDNDYSLKLKDRTGFTHAIYSSDGKTPKYDNTNPFTIVVTQKVNGYDEDVSIKTSSTYSVSYTWEYQGQIYDTDGWEPCVKLADGYASSSLEKNQKMVKPLDDYDGLCVTNALVCIVKKGGNEIGRIHIPIQLMLNRYGNSAINGWDGNSVNVNAEGGFILAPQMGAGIKESDNSFTGVVMGKVKEAGTTGEDVGLVGYAKGIRSIFLDAKTGKAVFGSKGKGQITIDPTKDTARIYSGNFYYNTKGYGTGLEIDLTTPRIRFGSGDFEVSKEGFLTARGGGSIAGWNIEDTLLYSKDKGVTLDSENKSIYSYGKDAATKTRDGFFLNGDALVLGSKFKASADGKLEIGTGAVAGGGNRRWTIDGDSNDSYIRYGTKGSRNSVYIGTSDIQLGTGFSVNSAGILKVGNLNGRYWTIAARLGTYYPAFMAYNHSISYGTEGEVTDSPSIDSDHPSDSMYIGTDGIAIGNRFKISAASSGSVELQSGDGGLDGTSGFFLSKNGFRVGNILKATATQLEIGRLTGKHWTISGKTSDTEASIAYGTKGTNGSAYFGTDGISIGRRFNLGTDDNGNFSLKSSNEEILTQGTGFFLDKTGLRISNKFLVQGDILKIGNINGTRYWTINGSSTESYMSYGTKGETSSVYIGTDGISLGKTFSVSRSGELRATAGYIGGWEIGSSFLKGGNIILNSNGSISGGRTYQWSIATDGTATFKRLTAAVTNGSQSWAINADGTVKFTAGEIGKWKIMSDGSLRSNQGSGKLVLNAAQSAICLYSGSSAGYVYIHGDGNNNSVNFSKNSNFQCDASIYCGNIYNDNLYCSGTIDGWVLDVSTVKTDTLKLDGKTLDLSNYAKKSDLSDYAKKGTYNVTGSVTAPKDGGSCTINLQVKIS